MAPVTPTVDFNNGLKMPILGLGTWKSKPGEVAQAVKDAIDIGYRHIDGALVYQNEKEVGEALKAKFDEGVIKREDIFITSKLWNTFHSKDRVIPALKQTLSDLGLDYVDLYLIHWPMGYQEGGELFPKDANDKFLYSDFDYLETWKELEECIKLGLVKSIGVSNFSAPQIDRILKICSIKPVNNQVECHPYLNQEKLINYCKSKGITVTAYSPLGSPDRPWAKPGEPGLMDDPKIKKLAEEKKVSPAQLLIRYQIERGVIVIPKSVTKSRIEENFKVLDIKLSADDVALIDTFNCNGRLLHLDWVKDHPHFPFHTEF